MMTTVLESPVDLQQITFASGLPGFPDVRNFVLMHTELAQDPFSIMKCVDDEELEFVVTVPHIFFPEYAPVIDDNTLERTGITKPEDVILLIILSVGEEAIDITANLMGPVVVNKTSRAAAQAVLAGQDYDLRQPLFSEEIRSAAKSD
jgi:flagellar assembly factor FliW